VFVHDKLFQQAGKACQGKQSSLLQTFFYYECKKFCNISARLPIKGAEHTYLKYPVVEELL
jgi:hypothetical protein